MKLAVKKNRSDSSPNVKEKSSSIERGAFSVLVKEHHRSLLVYARALTGEEHTSRDIVQDAFIVAWKKMESFDVSRDFAMWMRGIVRNKWRESLRKQSREISLDEETLEFLEADARQWDALRDRGGVFAKLEECLGKLPTNLSDAVKEFYYKGNSGEQAAEALHVKSGALRKRLERARLNLRNCLKTNPLT